MMSGNSPFVSKTARYNFLSRSGSYLYCTVLYLISPPSLTLDLVRTRVTDTHHPLSCQVTRHGSIFCTEVIHNILSLSLVSAFAATSACDWSNGTQWASSANHRQRSQQFTIPSRYQTQTTNVVREKQSWMCDFSHSSVKIYSCFLPSKLWAKLNIQLCTALQGLLRDYWLYNFKHPEGSFEALVNMQNETKAGGGTLCSLLSQISWQTPQCLSDSTWVWWSWSL